MSGAAALAGVGVSTPPRPATSADASRARPPLLDPTPRRHHTDGITHSSEICYADVPGTGRFDYLDGIRAVAIGAVLMLHWFSWYTPFFHGGSVGVDVFFVLSGFIITT